MNPSSNQKRIAFGYNRGPINQVILHSGQAAAVKLIFQLYSEGSSIAKIAEILESADIPSPQNKPKWGKQTISNILSNPHYLGDDIYPEIIEKGLFDEVQKRKAIW